MPCFWVFRKATLTSTTSLDKKIHSTLGPLMNLIIFFGKLCFLDIQRTCNDYNKNWSKTTLDWISTKIRSVRGRVVKVVDLKLFAYLRCGFECRQGLWVISCEEAIQLSYWFYSGARKGTWGLPAPVKLKVAMWPILCWCALKPNKKSQNLFEIQIYSIAITCNICVWNKSAFATYKNTYHSIFQR
jgi:hypothetical protein